MEKGDGPGGERTAGAREGGPDPARPSRRRWLLVASMTAASTLVVFALGFLVFVGSLDRAGRDPSVRADAIVALTGGAGRIEDAVDLLARGYASRLLITGVNERTSLDAIKRFTPGQQDIVDCCVDLDYRARNTAGNATEIARWVRANAFRSLIVVTSDYHVPRTLAELDEALPDVSKIPHPVVAGRTREDGAVPIRLLLSEYVKFLAVSLRTRAAGWWGRMGHPAIGAREHAPAGRELGLARGAAAG